MKGKSLIGVILAAICVTVTYLLPGSEELSHEGITALGVLGMASILWISNTLPFGVTGLLALVMLVLLGVSDMASVFVGFSNSSVIFVITVFCLTAAVMNTKLTLRLINKLLRWAGSSAEKLVLAYMAAAALLSSVMSNVPVTVLFLGLAQPVLKAVGAKPGSSRLGKCLMIGIPFAAVNGGMATPAGSSFNVLAMGVFESIAGKPLTFLQWMAVGLPTAIVATLVCWICLVKIFKPEAINEECSASIREEAENAGKISAYEKKVLFMLVAMPVLWILGTWFPALDVTVVSIIGFVVMFMQREDLLENERYSDMSKRIENRYELVDIIQAWLSKYENASEAIEILRSHDVPCAEVKADWEMHECPQLASRHYFEDIPFPKSIVEETGRKQYKIKGLPFKTSSDAENPDYLPLPEVGEHNYDVYGTVATKEEIDALLDRWHNKFHKY